jgi:hypothetical protein
VSPRRRPPATRESLGEPVRLLESLGPPRPGRIVRAAQSDRLGALVVKLRHGDRAGEKTEWCALNLPLPVPAGATQALLDRARAIAGDDAAHCLVSYRIIAHLAALLRRRGRARAGETIAVAERLLELPG